MIPNRLLGDNATLIHATGFTNDGYDDVATTETIELSNIAFDSGNAYTRSVDAYNDHASNELLLYDFCNSRPKGVEFAKEDIVIFDGQRYVVTNIDKARLNSHLEVQLSREQDA